MRVFAALLLLLPATALAQWQIQDSHTTADLRGIHAIGNGIAWASGTSGTVLRTTDEGKTWQACTIPPGADKLDFRGIQAFDANTAIVMSSGKGDLSRLYKTTDACKTWKLVFKNPYGPDAFFDAILFIDSKHGILLGDPTGASINTPTEYAANFRIRVTADGGQVWAPVSAPDRAGPGHGLHALPGESAFAASNSSLAYMDHRLWLATSAARVSTRLVFESDNQKQFLFQSMFCAGALDPASGECGQPWTDFSDAIAPMVHSSLAAGIFSLAFRSGTTGIGVGGDYLLPSQSSDTAAFTNDAGLHWVGATTPPHGYRSSVAYSPTHQTWITVGPNGTDISKDDGRNWQALRPSTSEAPDTDKNWNALSLPFVVGPKGRIGLLRPEAIKP